VRDYSEESYSPGGDEKGGGELRRGGGAYRVSEVKCLRLLRIRMMVLRFRFEDERK